MCNFYLFLTIADTKIEAFSWLQAHTHAHTYTLKLTHWAKTKEGMGTLSVLISRCRCVLEAVQGSTVIGLFSYWSIQSRTEGYGSQQSDPRIPLPAFHPLFLPPSSSALPSSLCLPVHPVTGALTGKTCGSWQAWQLERGHGATLSAQLQVSSHQDQMEESGRLGRAMKEQASGNMSGKKSKDVST